MANRCLRQEPGDAFSRDFPTSYLASRRSEGSAVVVVVVEVDGLRQDPVDSTLAYRDLLRLGIGDLRLQERVEEEPIQPSKATARLANSVRGLDDEPTNVIPMHRCDYVSGAGGPNVERRARGSQNANAKRVLGDP